MLELLHRDGFLGTNANFAADMTLTVSILIVALFSYGFYLARRGRYEAHRWVQTSAALLNLVFVLWMMILPYRDFVIRDFGNDTRPAYFYLMTTVHAVVGLPALLFGLFVVLRGNGLMIRPLRFANYRPYMRVAYGLYMAASVLGILVYLTWFVIVPHPPQFG